MRPPIALVLALAVGALATPAPGRTPLPAARLRRIEALPQVTAAMASLARLRGRALLVQQHGSRALLLTSRGFRFARRGTPLAGEEEPRYRGHMSATGWHDVFRLPLLSVPRSWRRQMDAGGLEQSVLRTIRRARRDLAQDRIREWNPVTGSNGSALVLVRRTLIGR